MTSLLLRWFGPVQGAGVLYEESLPKLPLAAFWTCLRIFMLLVIVVTSTIVDESSGAGAARELCLKEDPLTHLHKPALPP